MNITHCSTMKNRYIIRSRISEKKFKEILRLFCLDIEAKQSRSNYRHFSPGGQPIVRATSAAGNGGGEHRMRI